MIRALLKRDLIQVKDIHEKFYQKEFNISDLNKFMCSFVSVNATDEIIVAGGIKTIVEAVIVTNKDAKLSDRIDGLVEWVNTARVSTKEAGYDQIHAFIQDDKWIRHLKKFGFIETVGKSLVTGV